MQTSRGRGAWRVTTPARLALLTLVAAVGARGPEASPPPDAATAAPVRKNAFDPRRPPEHELEIGVADGFSLAAVGDCIISRPHVPMLARDSAFAAVVKILREADVAFGNFEDTAIDLRAFKGSPHSWLGDWTLIAAPEVAADLKTLGFDLLARANNHTFDWGLEGMLGPAKDCPTPDALPSETPDPRATSVPPDQAPAGLDLFGEHFQLGQRAAYHYEIDPIDLRENLQSIRLGKQHSDLLLASIHAHEEALGCGLPADFLRDLAHAAIDAGAGAFLGHGIHHLGPIEIYKGRPIFYGLGNFFLGDIQQPLPGNLFEQYRDLLAGALGDADRATDADLTALLNARDFQQERVFQTIVTVTRYERGRVSEIRLYPVDLGHGMRLTRSGVPRLASPQTARVILERLQRLSEPYGTTIHIQDNVGVIRPG